MNRRVSFDRPLLVARRRGFSKIACRVAIAHDCRRQYLGPSKRAGDDLATDDERARFRVVRIRNRRLDENSRAVADAIGRYLRFPMLFGRVGSRF